MNINKFISKCTYGKPHVKCVTYQQLWLNKMLLFVATANNGLSKNFRVIDSYIFPHLEHGKWTTNNAQILDGINGDGIHHISLRTLERATSNLSYIIWEDNDVSLVSKQCFGKYNKYMEWYLNPLLKIKHNPNDKVMVESYRIKPQMVKKLKLNNMLALVKDKKSQVNSQLNSLNHEENSIKWAIKQA